MRRLTLDVLLGNKPLPMEVKSWPVDDDVLEQQRNAQAQLVENQKAVMAQLVEILNRLTSGHILTGDRTNAVTPAPKTHQQ